MIILILYVARIYTRLDNGYIMRLLLITVLCIFSLPSFSQDGEYLREYPFSLGDRLDSRVIVRTSIALNKLGYDAFNQGMINVLSEKTALWVEPLWSFFWTFNFTMWPHDYGHWVRANQAGGDFIIEKYGFPFPIARMVVPPGATGLQKSLMSAGGFEINTMMREYTENRLYETGSRDAEDMVHGFIQTILFPMYTNLIAPTDPGKATTWINTYGDPVDVVKQVYEHYSGKSAVDTFGNAEPQLVALYNEFYWANIFAVLVDPLTYKMAGAFGADMRQRPRISSSWLYESNDFSWAYTSRFNPGALGYELYFTQHIQFAKRYLRLYLRNGRPFKNTGLGVAIPDLYTQGKFKLGAQLDIWDQDLFGTGTMLTVSSGYRMSPKIELMLDLHRKDDGYVIGHRLEPDAGLLFHITYYM